MTNIWGMIGVATTLADAIQSIYKKIKDARANKVKQDELLDELQEGLLKQGELNGKVAEQLKFYWEEISALKEDLDATKKKVAKQQIWLYISSIAIVTLLLYVFLR